jgi:DNA-binding CsgD family transcriptional regulator
MPDHVVILFMFGLLSGFGIVWLANDLRLRYQARYLEYNFYFILSSICYGFLNWIAPFVMLHLVGDVTDADLTIFVAIFVLMAVPVLLVKLFFLYLLFHELQARERPSWFNKASLGLSMIVLLISIWVIKLYFESANAEHAQKVIIGMGLVAVIVEFVIIINYLVSLRGTQNRVIGAYSVPFGSLLLVGYSVYVFMAYSGTLIPGSSIVELTPYVYFIIHGLPLVALWLFHHSEPAAVLKTGSPSIVQFIEDHALTAKESDILKQIIRGASNREIAEQNHVSPHTVRNHIYNIYNKTGIRNRFQLLAVCQADDESLVD